jgi:hypothetical protein
MHHNPFYLIAQLVFEAAAVFWAGWELWSVRPGKKDKAPPPTSEERPGHLER